MTETETVVPLFQVPQFNQADFVVDDLTAKLVKLEKENSILKSQVEQGNLLLKANKDLLGLVEDEHGNLSVPQPTPNRATRRAKKPRTP